jgi:multidrug resistance efflux pump
MNNIMPLILLATVLTAGAADSVRKLVCTGRVEAVDGELEVSAQMSGTLVAVMVKEGDWVTSGTVLAEVDARREKVAYDLALAKLARVKAGVGKEEIAAAEATRDAISAELVRAESEFQRTLKIQGATKGAIAEEMMDQRRQYAETTRKRLISATKQFEALQRGPLPEDIALAEAEVAVARTAYDLREIHAPSDGSILLLNKHPGDFVSLNFPSPILRMANTRKLRLRIEVSEQEVYRLRAGMAGDFTTYGERKSNGKLQVVTLLPAFAPRRLFEPDSTARMDTRTLQALCEISDGSAQVYAGQRIMATFALKE